MSQYPQSPQQMPYGYPGYGGPGMFDPLSRAKRAGTLMIVLGIIGLLCGGMSGFMASNWDQIMAMEPPEIRAALAEMKPITMIHAAEAMGVVSFLLLVLGIIVRRGAKWAIV